jgi:hypothetical protein
MLDDVQHVAAEQAFGRCLFVVDHAQLALVYNHDFGELGLHGASQGCFHTEPVQDGHEHETLQGSSLASRDRDLRFVLWV